MTAGSRADPIGRNCSVPKRCRTCSAFEQAGRPSSEARMNSRIFALHGALAALTLTAACKKDPTAPEVGTPKKLSFELDARTVAVADSFRSFVILRDRLGNPLATPVTVASCNAAVAAVIPARSEEHT